MKSISILPLAIVLATPCVIAQDTAQHPSPNIVSSLHSPLLTSGPDCPVGLRANHGSSFLIRETQDRPIAARPPVQEQRIELTMTNLSSREIVQALITVHGLSDKGRIIPVTVTPAPDLTKSIDLALDLRANGHALSELSLTRFASVTSVDLDSLTYADGAAWEASSPAACSVIPDPFLLVTAGR